LARAFDPPALFAIMASEQTDENLRNAIFFSNQPDVDWASGLW